MLQVDNFSKQFFRKYLILFLLVWDMKLSEADPADYLTFHNSIF